MASNTYSPNRAKFYFYRTSSRNDADCYVLQVHFLDTPHYFTATSPLINYASMVHPKSTKLL